MVINYVRLDPCTLQSMVSYTVLFHLCHLSTTEQLLVTVYIILKLLSRNFLNLALA